MGEQDDIIESIKAAAQAGRVVFLNHARTRMDERGCDVDDVMAVLLAPELVPPAHQDDRVSVVGNDLDGDRLTVVVELEWLGELVVITVF